MERVGKLERRARNGDVKAMVNLAWLLEGHDGVAKDLVRAVRLYERAAKRGSVRAMYNLGNLLRKGEEGVGKDLVRAKQLYERAVKRGDVPAMVNLGYLLKNGGEGVGKDLVRAKQLYERAAKRGNLKAMYNLGLLLQNGGEGVGKDLVRAKHFYEQAAEGGDVIAMCNLGVLLQNGGEGVGKDLVRAKQLYERAVEGGDLKAMYNLGSLLLNGGDGVAKDIDRAKRLLERSAESGRVLAQADVGYYLRSGIHGFQRNPVLAKQWLERAATAGNASAMLNLANLLEHGDDGVPKDVARARELYELAGKKKSAQACDAEEQRPSVLETAFASAVRDPSIIDEAFLVQNIVASNVNSATDLLWGHNLILLSIRAGIITRGSIRAIGGSSWYLQENLYYPASKLTEESGAVIDAIYQHAENFGIINSGYALRIGRGIRADMKKDLERIQQAIQVLSERVEALETNVGELHSGVVKLSLGEQTLQKAVDALTKSLNQLKEALQKQNKRMQYAQVARCILSFVPLIGKAIGETTYTAANILMNLTMEDLVPAGVDVTKAIVTEMACVDLSNFQVARYVFSGQVVSKLDVRARNAVTMSISTSEFKSPDELQRMLQHQIESIGREDACIAMMDIGSSAWASSDGSGGGQSEILWSSGNDALEERARRYFRFLVGGSGRDKAGIPETTEGINHLLKGCEGLCEVPPEEVEEVFFELIGEEDDEVTEEVFVEMFQTVRRGQEKDKNTEKVMEEARKRFRERVHHRTSLSLKYAARVLCKLYKELQEGGFIEEGTSLGQQKAVETLRRADGNGDDRIEEGEFMAAIKELLTAR